MSDTIAPDLEPTPCPDHGDMREAAHAWMALNPESMSWMRGQIILLAHKRRRASIHLLIQRLRWEWSVERGDSGFKINNNYAPYIARELFQANPGCCAEVLRFRATKYDRGACA